MPDTRKHTWQPRTVITLALDSSVQACLKRLVSELEPGQTRGSLLYDTYQAYSVTVCKDKPPLAVPGLRGRPSSTRGQVILPMRRTIDHDTLTRCQWQGATWVGPLNPKERPGNSTPVTGLRSWVCLDRLTKPQHKPRDQRLSHLFADAVHVGQRGQACGGQLAGGHVLLARVARCEAGAALVALGQPEHLPPR